MVTILHPDPEHTPRITRIPVSRPPVSAIVSTPDEGETFTITGLSRHEATILAIVIAENPVVGYVGHDLGRAVYPSIDSEAAS